MLKHFSKLLIIGFVILHTNLKGQQIIKLDSAETIINLSREDNDFGVSLFSNKFKFLDRNYKMIFIDDRNKIKTDSINIVNLLVKGGQSISANSYPFKNASIVFSIDKNICLFINKINPFDSTVKIKICTCPKTDVADTVVTEIPNIVVTDFFTHKQIDLKQYISENKGVKIAVNFWASSCSPCVKELPLIKELTKRGYLVINFCASFSEKEKVQEFITKFDVQGPQFIGGNDIIGNAFNQSGFPQLILFEPENKYPTFFRGIEQALEYLTDIKNKK